MAVRTKYIVNNLSGQTISGNLTIDGNLTTTTNNGTGTYKALLTQTGSINSTDILGFNSSFILGESYEILNYNAGDDFSNIANVTTGVINTTGCVFIATGATPNNWANGSSLVSSGGLIVNVVENTLGYDISWEWAPFGPGGYYIGVNNTTGPIFNSFPREKTDIKVGIKYPFDWGGAIPPIGIPGINNMINKDAMIFVDMFFDGTLVDNALYYTPVEMTIKQDLDTTPIQVYGTNVSPLPYGNVSVNLFADGKLVESFYGNYSLANDMNELVAALNNDPTTSYLGTFSVDQNVEGGVILAIPTNLKNQFSPNNTLTFEVFND